MNLVGEREQLEPERESEPEDVVAAAAGSAESKKHRRCEATSAAEAAAEAGGASEEKKTTGCFTQTFLSTEGEWTDPQYRWARGVAPSPFDEHSSLPVATQPPEQGWDGTPPPLRGGGKWCFYNVVLPHAELSCTYYTTTIRISTSYRLEEKTGSVLPRQAQDSDRRKRVIII